MKVARKLLPKKSFCENSALLFKLPEILNMVLTNLSFFHFLVNKKRNYMVLWWVRMLGMIFDLKNTPPNACWPNFHVLLAFRCSAFSSDQKCVRDFPWKAFVSRCFIFKPYVTFQCSYLFKDFYYCEKTNEKSGEFFKSLLKVRCQQTWFKTIFSPFFI